MKKIAIRGAIILAIVVACCMFFAQTIITITTPKVKFAMAGTGNFEEKVQFDGTLYFKTTDKIIIEGARKTPVTVEKMYVSVGDLVAPGDIICTTKLSDSFTDEVDAASEAFVQARDAYMLNETANIHLVPNTDSDKNEAYRKLNETGEALASAQSALLSAAAKEGIILTEDASRWASTVQRSENAELIALMDDVLDAQLEADAASEAFLEIYATSKTKDALYEFLNKRAELQRAMDAAQTKLVELVAGSEAMTTIRAEHEGYILSLNLSAGMMYDGSQYAYELNVEGEQPALRVDVSGRERQYTEGMRADIKTDWQDIRAEVSGVEREGVDGKYLIIPLTDEAISSLGGIRTLLNRSTTVSITYRAKDRTTIIPAAVLRNEGAGKDFVYVAEYVYGSGVWTSAQIKARKMSVTVVDRGDKDVSIQENLERQQIIYQEDRSFEDGDRVMEYLN